MKHLPDPKAKDPSLPSQRDKDDNRKTVARRPLLSILIPAYRARMLAQCLQSISETVARDLACEIVVVDDCSPEKLADVVAPLAKADGRIRYVRNEKNLGIPANFNRTLAEARGKYVCLMGDDDGFYARNFDIKLAVLEQNPDVGLAYSRWAIVDDNLRQCEIGSTWHAKSSYVGGRREFDSLFVANYINLACAVFRRELWEHQGSFDEQLTALCDWDMFLRWTRSTQTAFVNEPLVWVREHAASDSSRRGVQQRLFATEKLAVWRKWLLSDDSLVVIDEARWGLLQAMFRLDLQTWFGDDPVSEDFLREFQRLRQEYEERATRRFGVQTRSLQAAACDGHQKSTAVVLTGGFWEPSAGGADVRSLVRLADAGPWPVRVEPRRLEWPGLGPSQARDKLPLDDGSLYDRLAWTPVAGKNYVQLWHGPPSSCRPEPAATARILRTACDFDRLPDEWLAACNGMDLVCVPTWANAARFIVGGVAADRLRVLPECVDTDAFGPHVQLTELRTERGFNFLSIADWHWRHAPDVLLRAFTEEFGADEDVALVLVVQPVGQSLETLQAEIPRIVQQTGKTTVAPMQIQVEPPAPELLPGLYRGAQAYVQTARVDGWHHRQLEAMASALPVIGTHWGENLEFCSYPVESRLASVPAEVRPAGVDGELRWAEPSVEHLRAAMRQAFSNRSEAAQLGEQARLKAVERHSREAVGKRLSELLEEVGCR